jgi:hypothetical protein
MSHPAPVFWIHSPVLLARLAIQSARKAEWRSGAKAAAGDDGIAFAGREVRRIVEDPLVRPHLPYAPRAGRFTAGSRYQLVRMIRVTLAIVPCHRCQRPGSWSAPARHPVQHTVRHQALISISLRQFAFINLQLSPLSSSVGSSQRLWICVAAMEAWPIATTIWSRPRTMAPAA